MLTRSSGFPVSRIFPLSKRIITKGDVEETYVNPAIETRWGPSQQKSYFDFLVEQNCEKSKDYVSSSSHVAVPETNIKLIAFYLPLEWKRSHAEETPQPHQSRSDEDP